MYTIYQSKANEIDESLLESIKALYRDKEIEITVVEVDDTDYLLRSPSNRESLMRAVGDIESGRNIVVPDEEQLQ